MTCDLSIGRVLLERFIKYLINASAKTSWIEDRTVRMSVSVPLQFSGTRALSLSLSLFHPGRLLSADKPNVV